MFAASKTNTPSGGTPDPQFNYVTMLLHGDGTNGAQNNTFLDSSTNNFTITRNGNTTQGSFSPYGSNWSNAFNGTNAYFSIATNAALRFGTGNFTVECWVFFTGTDQKAIFDFGANNASGWGLYDDGSIQFRIGDVDRIQTPSPTSNNWHHIAVVRSGTTATMYIDGTSRGSYASASTDLTYSGTNYIGCFAGNNSFANGYISNVRVVKGTAVYTGNFTPSTTPLTAISGTSLLTCQSNRFIDNSSNNFTLTVGGTPSVQRFNPFGTSTAYSTAVIGGSGYFDGSGDTLTCTGTLPATADFTLSLWVYPTSLAGYAVAIQQSGSGNTFYLYLGYADGKTDIQVGSTNYADYTAGVYKAGQWNYVQVVKQSSAYSFYVNGTALSVTANTGNIGTTSIATGTLTVNYNTGCYITDVRIVNTALGNSVPTAPLTAVSGTTMLLSMQNGAIFDNAMMNDLETVGNAQISTSVTKFGTGSISLSASGNTLRTQYNNPSLSMGTGAFTIEGWVYFSSTPSTNGVFQMSGTSGGFAPNQTANLALATNNSTSWQIYAKNTFTTSSTTTIAVGSWIHFALVRSGTTTVLYINGTALITLTSDSTNYNTPYIGLGAIYDATSYPLGGYIDDLRITKGFARYTANFTAPTAAFSDTGPY